MGDGINVEAARNVNPPAVPATDSNVPVASPVLAALQSPDYRPQDVSVPLSLTQGMSDGDKNVFQRVDRFVAGPRDDGLFGSGKLELGLAKPEKLAVVHTFLQNLEPEVAAWIAANHISKDDQKLLSEHGTKIEAEAAEAAEIQREAEQDQIITEVVPALREEITGLKERIATLEQGLERPQETPATQRASTANGAEDAAVTEDPAVAAEKAEADEAKKSGFLRGLVEIFEFMGRWFLPFTNLLSAGIRLAKIGYKLFKGEEIDWAKEGLRLAGDVAGILFPPMGAMANLGLNMYYNESEILGGVNEFFDDGKKDNYFRRQLDTGLEWAGDQFGKLTGDDEAPKASEAPTTAQPALRSAVKLSL